MKKIILLLFLFLFGFFISYASATLARDRKSNVLPWLGVLGEYDLSHNVGNSHEAENSRFSFVNGTLKGDDVLVRDSITGLIWESIPSNEVRNWRNSIIYCNLLEKGGYNDWRLPTIKELISITDYSKYHPVFNTNFFSISENYFYWTSTTQPDNFNNSYAINFYHGYDESIIKSKPNLYSICVRSDN